MAALRTQQPPTEPASSPPPRAARPLGAQDLGQLLDIVEAGIGAVRAHLVALSASLERIAQELDIAAPPLPEAPPTVLPPQREGRAKPPAEPAAPKAPGPHAVTG